MKQTQKGFTLVEIAIVLVIIGLLLGGILKGQEMITQAKIKNVMSDYSGISAAYHGYLDRYRVIPGDDSGATTRWTSLPSTAKGNGNGIVEGTYKSTTADAESRLFWLHLRTAGFVSGDGQNQPFNAVTGLLGVQTGDGQASTAATLLNAATPATGFVSLIICSANLPDKIAIAVDTQMDDGVPNQGTVRGVLQTAPNPDVGTALAASTAYVENGSNTYTLCRAF